MATGERGRRLDEVPEVSLGAPRPDAARAANQYVETPLRYSHSQRQHPSGHSQDHIENNNKNWQKVEGSREEEPRLVESEVEVTTRQPASGGKWCGSGPRPRPAPPCSIICPRCGKCRCQACRSPRAPPSAWLCSDFCYCSLDSCVDYASCLCCVKGLVYHWSSGDGRDPSCADDPCSCSGSGWLSRWACLGLTSLLLPCLCCYCPLKAAADGCRLAYGACSQRRGCTCRPLH